MSYREPLRILQSSDAYYPFPGGVSEHMHYLSLYLRERGHRVTILTADYGSGTAERDVVRIGRVRILPPLKAFNMTQLTVTFEPGLHLKVRDFLRRNEFDVVHTHGPLAPNLPHLALHYSRSANVATFHTTFVGFNWHKLGKFLFRADSRKIDCFIGVSEVALDVLRGHYRGKMRVIPNGIDIERFSPSVEPEPDILRLSGIKILYVGRMEPRKGFPYLLRAFEMLVPRHDLQLIAVGSGVEEHRYREMVPPHLKERVHFFGFAPPQRLPRLYRSADIFTSPAVGGETFGIVLLEAMASAIPVVASDIPGYREVLTEGKEGLFADVRDSAHYAHKLEILVRDKQLRKKMGKAGREKALSYSWEEIAARMEDVYREILEQRRLLRSLKGKERRR